MRVLLGEPNVTLLEDLDPIMDGFNAWSLNKAFASIHEILPDGKNDVAKRLRGTITESTRKVNMKGIERFDAENRTNIMGATNFPNAVKIMADDGRWLVVKGTTDRRHCDESGNPTQATADYYSRLFRCIGTPTEPGPEARRILRWMLKRDLSAFDSQGAAPRTEAKSFVAGVTQGKWAAWFTEALAEQRKPFDRELFTAEEARGELPFADAFDADARSPKLSAALIEAGCRKVKDDQVRLSDGQKVRLWTLSPGQAKVYAAMSGSALAKNYEAMLAKQSDTVVPTEAEEIDDLLG
jgi:hypothetical protein